MKENVLLLQEINELRTEVHTLKQKNKLLTSTGRHAGGLGSTGRSQMDQQ